MAGLQTRIYQSVRDGALAFLVVVLSAKYQEILPSDLKITVQALKLPALTWRRSPVKIRQSSPLFLKSVTLEPSIEAFSDTTITMKKKHNKDKKVHN